MSYTAKQLFADWYRKADKKADETTLQKRIDAIATIISEKDEIAFWLDIARIALGIKVGAVQTFIQYFKTSDLAFPVRNSENTSKVLANAILCFKLEDDDNDINDKLSLAILNSQSLGGAKFIEDIPVVENADSHVQIRIIDDRKITNREESLIDLDNEAAGEDFVMNDSHVTTITTAMRELSTQNKLLLEETNILWWLIAETSKTTRKTFLELGLSKLAFIAPLELFQHSQFPLGIPTPYDILSKVLYIGNDRKPKFKELSFYDAVEQLSESEKQAIIKVAKNNIDTFTPCLAAIKFSLDAEGDNWSEKYEKLHGISARQNLSANTIALEIYNELLYANL